MRGRDQRASLTPQHRAAGRPDPEA
ncbi:hypothetical protein MC885_001546 [Smutsia gigantea]|nr:hypothetical protein MC885_001546 [Smutsia gigantea]